MFSISALVDGLVVGDDGKCFQSRPGKSSLARDADLELRAEISGGPDGPLAGDSNGFDAAPGIVPDKLFEVGRDVGSFGQPGCDLLLADRLWRSEQQGLDNSDFFRWHRHS